MGSNSNSSSSSNVPMYLKTKAATLIVHLILLDAADGKETLQSDLLQLAQTQTEVFLKTTSILVQELLESGDKQQTRLVKDVLKGYGCNDIVLSVSANNGNDANTVLQTLFECVLQILQESLAQQNSNRATSLSILALQSIRTFLTWTTLEVLTTNQPRALELLLVSLERPDSLLQCLLVWQEWVTSKTCQADASLKKVEEKTLHVEMAILERIHKCNILPYQGESSFDIEIVIQAAKLIDTMGQALLEVHLHQIDSNESQTAGSIQLLEAVNQQVLDLFLRAFQYDDIDVSSAVIPFGTRLVSSAEKDTKSIQYLPQLIHALFRQLKYPEDFAYDHEDEDEAEEVVYRAELSKLYTQMVRVSPETCLQFLGEAVAQFHNVTAPGPDVEATLRLVYHFCEGVRPPPGLKVVLQNDAFCQLLITVIRSDLFNHSHSEVLLLYYDVAVRYCSIFQRSEYIALLAQVLQAITGVRGLQHDHAKVRSRSCYLLLRLVKSLTSLMRPSVETAVVGIQGLLSNANLDIRPDDALYLFETIGLLLGKTGIEPIQQQQYLAEIMTPHVCSIERVLAMPGLQSDADHYGEILSGSIAVMAHLSKGFFKPSGEVQAILSQTLSITLRVLEAMPSSEQVRNKAMVLLQRMILCIEEQVLPSIPPFLFLLIRSCTVDDVAFVSQIFNQVCIKFKENAAEVLDTALLPFLHKCHSLVPAHEQDDASGLPPHLRTEQLSTQKLSFAVLQHIVHHQATAMLISSTNVANLESILRTAGDGAIYVTDPVIKRTCLRFFRDLGEQWAGGDSVYCRGLLTYMHQTLLPGVFRSFMDSSFDERDANQNKNVHEFAKIIISLKTKMGDEVYQQHTVSVFAATGCFPPDILHAIQSVTSVEDAEKCFGELFKRVKRSS